MNTLNSHNNTTWRIDKDTYIPIKDMESEHIQKAIYFSENKMKKSKDTVQKATHSFKLFKELRKNLLEELSSRGLEADTLIDETSEFYELS